MKKILNSAANYVDECLDGMCSGHPDYYAQPIPRVIARARKARDGKVGIVTGGGSGHLPIFTGYVGKGLLDAAAIGDVFASPTPTQIMETIKQADHGAGVLQLYGNYGGDLMNFDIADEMLELERDTPIMTVVLADDIASASLAEREKRRGVAGMVYAFKIAGAAAERMFSLDEVTRIAQKTADSCYSLGMALTPCIVPQAGKPTFLLADNEMEMGMGIHGETGIWRDTLKPADVIVDEMVDRLLADCQPKAGDRVSVLVNSLGATPAEELYIMFRRLKARFDERKISIVMPLIGRYATSMEMTGASLTICTLDDELEGLLKDPADCPFLKV